MKLRRRFCLLGVLLLMLVSVSGKDEDYGGGSSADVEQGSSSSNDEIYEPTQLESVVETEHERNSLEGEQSALPTQTDNALSMEQELTTTMRPANASEAPTVAVVTERDENTAAEVMEEQHEAKQMPAKSSQEYYYDEMQEEEHKQQPQLTTSTTSIPEYVRQPKAERLPADYNEDGILIEQQTQSKPQELELHYQDEPTPPQAHKQQLPHAQQARPFKQNSEEYYYDEQSDSLEQHVTSTSTEAYPVLQARFGGFIGNWPTLTPNTLATNAPPTTTSSTTTSTTTTPTPTTTTTASSTTAPRKQSKHIHLAKPELLPADQLRNYIKDVYIRMPLAVIVDPSAASLDQAKRLFNDALQDKNINIKIVLVTLNASGVPSAFSFNNTREFIAGLNSTKVHEGGDAFVGVLQAAELVPYDSAIFISTAAVPPHTEMVQDAAITLLKKRIRLFMLWYGERSASENETEEAVGGILGEVAIRSGGEIIHIVSTEHGQHIAGNTLTLVSDVYQGSQELELPVDTTLSSLHVRIDANMRRATLATPTGG